MKDRKRFILQLCEHNERMEQGIIHEKMEKDVP